MLLGLTLENRHSLHAQAATPALVQVLVHHGPPPVPLAEREPTLHIPDDVLRHLRRGDGTLLGAPPPLLQPLVLEAAAPHLLKAATARAGGSCGRGCNPSGGGCNPMCGGCTPMCARGCTAIPWHVHVPMACAHGMCSWHVPMACACACVQASTRGCASQRSYASPPTAAVTGKRRCSSPCSG